MTHNFGPGACPHRDCGGQDSGECTGYQAACCGHYYPRTRVAIGPDSEPYCRDGMGCQSQAARDAQPGQRAKLLAQAADADRDADSEWPGSYYRKAHRARARRLRARAARVG